MNDDTFLVNDGQKDVKEVPVESKEATLSKDEIGINYVGNIPAKKKRGRPSKKAVAQSQEYYCSTCRERYSEEAINKQGAGAGRFAAFCPNCAKFLNFFDLHTSKKMDQLLRHPTSK